MTPAASSFTSPPLSFAEILRRTRSRLNESRPLVVMGCVGIVVGLICVAVMMARGGRPIPPEGDLTKAASFDAAIGIYAITLALLLPSSGEALRRRPAKELPQ